MTKYEEQSEVLKQPLGSSPTQDTERLKANFQKYKLRAHDERLISEL